MEEASASGKQERDNLGWLASSTMPARKRRHIEGISTTGIFELQAQLYRSQEHAKLRADGLVDQADTHPLRRPTSDPYAGRNAGVEARSARDKLQLKGTAADPYREEAVSAALEAKAKVYERLARGEAHDEDERYDVDFVRKGMLAEEAEDGREGYYDSGRRRGGAWSDDEDGERHRGAVDLAGAAALAGEGGLMSADMERERERRRWEDAEQTRMAAEAQAAEVRAVHKEAIRDLSAQTAEGRERAASLRQRKEAQLAAKRERLKAAFIQKQMGRVVGSSAGASQQRGAGAVAPAPGPTS